MVVMLLILLILVIWAVAGDIQKSIEDTEIGGTKYNTVNNNYNDCDVNDEYNGIYEVNNNGN